MIEDKNIMYNELIFWHSGGDPVRMSELKRFDVFDFFSFIEINERKLKHA